MLPASAIVEHLAPFDAVLFTLVFGSRVEGSPRPDSDLDVAVFLDPRLTAQQRWEARLRLQAALEDLGPVDVVILNDAPPLLAHRALLGKPIEIRNRKAYVRFFVQSLARAEDERFYRGLHRVARLQRLEEGRFGRSWVFDRRLGRLEELLRDLRALADTVSREEYLHDRGLKTQAERWLHLATECALDLANHLIADRGWRTPSTYRESFAVLREQGVLTDDLARKLERWAGLRNVLVHLYLDVDHGRLWEVLRGELDQLEALAGAVAKAASLD